MSRVNPTKKRAGLVQVNKYVQYDSAGRPHRAVTGECVGKEWVTKREAEDRVWRVSVLEQMMREREAKKRNTAHEVPKRG